MHSTTTTKLSTTENWHLATLLVRPEWHRLWHTVTTGVFLCSLYSAHHVIYMLHLAGKESWTCRYFFAHKNERKYFCSVTQRCFIWWNRRRWCQPRIAFCNVTSLNVSTRSSSCSRNTSWASCQHCVLTSYRNVVSSCSVIFLILIQKHKIHVHRLIELRFCVSLDTKWVISETLFLANLFA